MSDPVIPNTSGAWLLLLLRDRRANDWDSLCRELGLDPYNTYATNLVLLRNRLDSLRAAGLIKYGEAPAPDPPTPGSITGTIELRSRWARVQTALGLTSLQELADLARDTSMVVNPFFGRPKRGPLRQPAELFVLMPFQQDLAGVYEDHITNVADRLKVTAGRADNFFTAQAVMDDIWGAISTSRVVIADCTRRNPNVFYEIGIAHTIGKPVVLITQNNDDVPFDLRHVRFIHYTFNPRGMQQFEQELLNALQGLGVGHSATDHGES